MCFAIPHKVRTVYGDTAKIDNGRIVHTGRLGVKQGDFILIFADLAIEKVTKTQAKYMAKLVKGKS